MRSSYIIAPGYLPQTSGGVIAFPPDTTQTFEPGAVNSGLNVGSVSSNPSTTVDGDIWYNSTTEKLTTKVNGAVVELGESKLVVVELDLVRAQCQALDGTPITVVAAPGSGKIAFPMEWSVQTITTVASGGPAPVYRLRWSGQVFDPVANVNSGAASIQDFFMNGDGASVQPSPTSLIVNVALVVDFSLAIGATWNGSARITVSYYLVNFKS